MFTRLVFVLATLLVVPVFAAEDFAAAAAKAAGDYQERLKKAAEQLAATRKKIADEKAPLLSALSAAEERVVAAQTESTRIETATDEARERRRQLQKERDAVQKNLGYASTLAHDAVVAVHDSLAPGEEQLVGARWKQAIERFDAATKGASAEASSDALDLLLGSIEQSAGGYQAPGRAVLANTNELVEGTYAFAGPDAFFRAASGDKFGVVRTREGSVYPILYPMHDWKPAAADGFFQGPRGTMPADTTGGKALRLQETKGTLVEHIKRGGVVSFAILGVGLLSLTLILNKFYDLLRLQVDEPEEVEAFLKLLNDAPPERHSQLLRPLRAVTRDLLGTGLKHIEQPKQILEEHLWAVLMRLRLHYERRLPLLAVIAVAAPLMGLLGTVTGMVRTFALITVFGTGNAGKLASGISEVLVATELGLIVAIPSLVAHGFLSNRIQKKLSLLERYSLQFATAAQRSKREDEVSVP
ncbi:MAG: MotA/TolQ/ExbB proton channel family protein [Opitutae bacterium]|nr:MotA/TolQ/ExbB proton channel family protein [Opitutae bacterium]